ncbi:MAG: hypothetical protein C0592_00705 [Marinilabiliales bacterium]|nr:MAG: hypothetical protein C0592_00705 [Marinilabiliales bacterium]
MKKKAPGLAKATGIIEIIMGTILIILSITFLVEESSPTGYLMLISGLIFWGFGIAFFRFSKGAWFANLIMLILAKTGLIYLMLELVKEFGGWIMEDEMYVLFGILAVLLMLLIFTLASKKHLK